MGDITALLRKARDENDSSAIDLIVGALYPDLHRMAQAQLAKNHTITLLDTTSMVHEAYERLRSAARIEADCRGQFMAYASQVMRSVIVDFVAQAQCGTARRWSCSRHLVDRSSGWRRRSDEDMERVNEALEELASVDQRLKQVVEMRYFGGFAEDEIGEALGVSERTVRRDWERAKLLLQVAIRR